MISDYGTGHFSLYCQRLADEPGRRYVPFTTRWLVGGELDGSLTLHTFDRQSPSHTLPFHGSGYLDRRALTLLVAETVEQLLAARFPYLLNYMMRYQGVWDLFYALLDKTIAKQDAQGIQTFFGPVPELLVSRYITRCGLDHPTAYHLRRQETLVQLTLDCLDIRGTLVDMDLAEPLPRDLAEYCAIFHRHRYDPQELLRVTPTWGDLLRAH